MASADFSAPSFRRYRRPWPFRAGVEISRNKTHFFRSAGCGFTTLLRLGLGLRLASQTCPQVGLVSASCAYPPNFASGFLHPRPHGRKLALGYLVPPNWPIGDLHSRPCVMSCVHKKSSALTEGFKWLTRRDSNPNKQNQNLLCYRYTTGQSRWPFRLAGSTGLEPATPGSTVQCANQLRHNPTFQKVMSSISQSPSRKGVFSRIFRNGKIRARGCWRLG